MFLRVDRQGFALCEPHDFKRLHVEAGDAAMTREDIAKAVASIATVEDDSLWIEVAALKRLGEPADPDWGRGFDAMIASVRRFGWASQDGARVRCHLKNG